MPKTVQKQNPRCIIIAGPNGSGKTTFAREFLPKDASIGHFINADLIAYGLSPLKPELARIEAGKLFITELDRMVSRKVSFAFESTLSGFTIAAKIRTWRKSGYRIEIIFLQLRSLQIALHRISARVKQGGHHVPEQDVRRRLDRGWTNFKNVYKPLADAWTVYDNSNDIPQLIEKGP